VKKEDEEDRRKRKTGPLILSPISSHLPPVVPIAAHVAHACFMAMVSAWRALSQFLQARAIFNW
jgi:hypothetical protein